MTKKKLTKKERQRITAYHEIGHALMLWSIDYGFQETLNYVSIVEDESSAGRINYDNRWVGNWVCTKRSEIRVFLAGHACEEVMMKKHPKWRYPKNRPIGYDKLYRWKTAIKHEGHDIQHVRELLTHSPFNRKGRKIFNNEYIRAKRFLEKNWEIVEEMAKLLMRVNYINGNVFCENVEDIITTKNLPYPESLRKMRRAA